MNYKEMADVIEQNRFVQIRLFFVHGIIAAGFFLIFQSYSIAQSSIEVSGPYSFLNRKCSITEICSLYRTPDRLAVVPYHASVVGGGSAYGFVGFGQFKNEKVFFRLRGTNAPNNAYIRNDDSIYVHELTFRNKKSGIRLNGSVGIGTKKGTFFSKLGIPESDRRKGFGKEYRYGRIGVQTNIFGRIKRIIIY